MLSGAAFSLKSTKKWESLMTNVRLGLVLRLVAVSLSFGSRSKASREVETMWTVSINSLFSAPILSRGCDAGVLKEHI